MNPHMKTFLLASVVVFLIGDLFANGGGYITGGAERSGDITGFEPQATESIRMAEEDLHIKLGPKRAKVEIRYRMENLTKQRVSVRFGFPVEEVPAVQGLGIGAMLPPAGDFDVHPEPLYCQGYRLFDGKKEVKTKWQAEKRSALDDRFSHLAGWFVSEVAFAPAEAKEWTIRFETIYPFKRSSVSEDEFISAARFKYRLSTAACWAGTIGKGRIVLEPDGIDPDELQVIKPANRFQKMGEGWVWEFDDFEPSLADDFEVEAQPEISRYSSYSEASDPNELGYEGRGHRWSIIHANYEVTASSTLLPEGDRGYDPGNLKEWGRAWAEGATGSGIGEWLEIKPKVAKPLSAITFVPGFPEKSLFIANARPKRVRVEINEEYSTTAEIEDGMATVRIPVSGYNKPVSKIRLVIEEVWPGARFEDLCLHTLRLHVRVDRKPNFQPAR